MRGRWINYNQEELDWIYQHRTLVRRVAYEKFQERFNRPEISFNNFRALCKRKGWLTGRTGHYPKGHVPENKGKKMTYNPNSARTQFKKGHQPHNTKYLGHERVSKDGYVEISIAETNPHTGYDRRYVLKHKHLWEQENGPVPEGFCLKCLDGNRQNCDPSNWELISRSMLPRLSGRYGRGYDHAPEEVKPTIMAVTKLESQAAGLKSKQAGTSS